MSIEVERFFSEQSPLATEVASFRPRVQQREMALAVADAIRDNAILVAEAGTGTGKTFAYLVPALLAGGKVIISTGTKNLQDQLFQKDLPKVRDALKAPVTIALLKGRANYVCHHHLELTQSDGRFTTREDIRHLGKVCEGHAIRRQKRSFRCAGECADLDAGHIHTRKLFGAGMPAAQGVFRTQGT